MGILNGTFGEPQLDLLLGVLDGVRSMADVTANSQSIVTTDGAWGRGKGVCGTEHGTAGLDGVQTLPDHSNDRARSHILD